MRLPPEEAKRFMALYIGLIGWCAGRLGGKAVVRDVQSFLDAPMEDKADARDGMLDNPKVIDEFVAENPHGLRPEDLALVAAWRTFVRGNLVVERDLKRHTVFLDWKEPPVAYAVLSLTEEIVDLLPLPLPMMIEAVLLPWKGRIVCDGLIRYRLVHIGPGIRREIRDAYREAKARGIVTMLGAEPAPVEKEPRMSKLKKSSRGGKSGSRGKPRSPKTAFVGKWRIFEMEAWDEDYFEMDGPAYVVVEKDGTGHFKFGLVEGEMDCRFAIEDDRPVVKFSWEGADEGEPVSGRGRAVIDDKGKMRGRIFIHKGDDSEFVAKRAAGRRGARARRQ